VTSRYRTKGALTFVPFMTGVEGPVSCTPVAYSTTVYPGNGNIKAGSFTSMSDVVSPGYGRRIKRGEFIFNWMVSSSRTVEFKGSSNVKYTTVANSPCAGIKSTYTYTGSVFARTIGNNVGFQNLSFLDPRAGSNLQKEIWTSCMAERQRNGANFVESLAELEKSFAIFGKPLENVIKFLRAFPGSRKSGRHSRGFPGRIVHEAGKSVSSEYLRYRYGISPLIEDVKAAMKAWRTRYSGKVERISSRKRGDISENSVSVGSFTDSNCTWNWATRREETLKVRAVYFDEYTRDPFNQLGLTYVNLIGLPWELLHFSFVYDWFVNFGDLLYANIPRLDVRPLGGGLSTTRTVKSTFTPSSMTAIQPVWSSITAPSDTVEMTNITKERVPGNQADTGLVIKSDFRLDHFTRAADLTAIITQLSGRYGFR